LLVDGGSAVPPFGIRPNPQKIEDPRGASPLHDVSSSDGNSSQGEDDRSPGGGTQCVQVVSPASNDVSLNNSYAALTPAQNGPGGNEQQRREEAN
jgi:hypothetical protein